MTVETYIVSAEHPSEEYRLDHKPIKVEIETAVFQPNTKSYQAVSELFGIGKRKRSAVDAIMSLLTENGCTNVYIHRKAPKEANDSGVLPEDVLGVVQNHLEQLEKK